MRFEAQVIYTIFITYNPQNSNELFLVLPTKFFDFIMNSIGKQLNPLNIPGLSNFEKFAHI
jgi:hypothetical protein